MQLRVGEVTAASLAQSLPLGYSCPLSNHTLEIRFVLLVQVHSKQETVQQQKTCSKPQEKKHMRRTEVALIGNNLST